MTSDVHSSSVVAQDPHGPETLVGLCLSTMPFSLLKKITGIQTMRATPVS